MMRLQQAHHFFMLPKNINRKNHQNLVLHISANCSNFASENNS